MENESKPPVAVQKSDDDSLCQDRRQFFGRLAKGGAQLAAGLLLLPGVRHKDEVAADNGASGEAPSAQQEAMPLVEGTATIPYCPALVGVVTTFTYSRSGRLVSMRSEGGNASSQARS